MICPSVSAESRFRSQQKRNYFVNYINTPTYTYTGDTHTHTETEHQHLPEVTSQETATKCLLFGRSTERSKLQHSTPSLLSFVLLQYVTTTRCYYELRELREAVAVSHRNYPSSRFSFLNIILNNKFELTDKSDLSPSSALNYTALYQQWRTYQLQKSLTVIIHSGPICRFWY